MGDAGKERAGEVEGAKSSHSLLSDLRVKGANVSDVCARNTCIKTGGRW